MRTSVRISFGQKIVNAIVETCLPFVLFDINIGELRIVFASALVIFGAILVL